MSQAVTSAFQRSVDDGAQRLSRSWPALFATGAVGDIDVGVGILGMLVEDATGIALIPLGLALWLFPLMWNTDQAAFWAIPPDTPTPTATAAVGEHLPDAGHVIAMGGEATSTTRFIGSFVIGPVCDDGRDVHLGTRRLRHPRARGVGGRRRQGAEG